MTPTLVRFPSEVLDRVDAIAGDKHRAQFIREAVVSEVERREQASSRKKSSTRKKPSV
jgi:metal-responsive CopG/Arc/MetJ family transcriptional regulator